jgi:hypothetical protein
MSRKIISLFTSLAFIVFSVSCHAWKTKEIRTAADWQGKEAKILWVIKTSGEYIEFSEDNPGRIYGDKIAGTAVVLSKEVEITRDNINIKRLKINNKKGMISEITYKDGKIYKVVPGEADLTGKEEGRIIIFFTYETSESVIIPLSEVKSLKVKNIDIGVSLLFVGAVCGLWALARAILYMDD